MSYFSRTPRVPFDRQGTHEASIARKMAREGATAEQIGKALNLNKGVQAIRRWLRSMQIKTDGSRKLINGKPTRIPKDYV